MKALILTGDGINCANESALAFQKAGGEAHVLHVNDFLRSPQSLHEFSAFCLPGGFSFGDELRSGKILAEKLRKRCFVELTRFHSDGGMTLGVCNGFQVLMQLGLFEESTSTRTLTLSENDHGRFQNFWVSLQMNEKLLASPWLKGLKPNQKLFMPVRHKEGRITSLKGSLNSGQIAFRYDEAINGSLKQAAGIVSPCGRILGLMPHPEAALYDFLNPMSVDGAIKAANADHVLQIFKNGLKGKTQ